MTIDSYSESNYQSDNTLYSGIPGQGQSFTGDGNTLGTVKFYLKKSVGSPTGNAVAKIYAHSGTFGTSSIPTGSALATSDNFDVSTLTSSPQLITFTFSGANQISLTNGTKYVVTVEYSGGNGSNTVGVGGDATSPTHGGNRSELVSGTWSAFSTSDLIFYVISTGVSASPSQSPSASISPSGSLSPSASESKSQSPSPSASASVSPSPLPTPAKGILKIAKPGFNVLTTSDPNRFIFSSEYGTLKYFSKQSINISFDANASNISATGSYTHNLGYYPFCEVFVRVYIGSPAGNYEYCPFAGAGATVLYDATYKITTTQIVVYGQINGVSSSVWNFDFLVFIYKNNLNL